MLFKGGCYQPAYCSPFCLRGLTRNLEGQAVCFKLTVVDLSLLIAIFRDFFDLDILTPIYLSFGI